ncbi:hypothetical protein GOP47_0024839 [Adiantum capillus-veneris]|uniref:Pollen Ole e 1 allergen and extensin family protein n=1 Tax=Adiantum capillus-veneris TaxID=13818 RepID=A0A9D4U4R9_ADICA|nr:hypothetical protein GOP47_0024839 [Adiantum capillus-veneris]
MECLEMAVVLLLAVVALSSAGLTSADGGYYLTGHPLHKPPVPYGKPAYKPLALSVQGVVFCQNCLYVGTGSLTGAKPLTGARVQLACRDRRYKTFLYDIARTDENGYFLLTIPNFDYRRHNPLRTCRVFLLSSFSPSCSRRTNINSGRFGASLRLEKAYPDQVLYTVGPFAFAPPTRCKATTPTYYTPPSYTPSHPPPSYGVSPISSPTYSPPPPIYASPPNY